ncbi:MAG: metalloregulator ArsR/SmtB family transcription factor [Pyrinomonadaceae bacterium]|nr:metalloregulator ArsR/SmtB family transcription factor [Pyrinomonadaceae bacterium]
MDKALAEMEKFFMALADKTRLRLLNLMRQNEVCVCFFTEVLGESQPKISRHLAYLRNAGVVSARRDGKWMHYRIAWPADSGARRTLESALDWLAGQDDLRLDLEKYEAVCCTPELLVQIARTPMEFMGITAKEVDMRKPVTRSETLVEEEDEDTYFAVDGEPATHPQAHNELEEFLL